MRFGIEALLNALMGGMTDTEWTDVIAALITAAQPTPPTLVWEGDNA